MRIRCEHGYDWIVRGDEEMSEIFVVLKFVVGDMDIMVSIG